MPARTLKTPDISHFLLVFKMRYRPMKVPMISHDPATMVFTSK